MYNVTKIDAGATKEALRVQGTTERCQVGQEKRREEHGGGETELEKKTGTHFLTSGGPLEKRQV